MSRIQGARLQSAIITNKEELLTFLEFDEDICGNNGDDFTMEEALENGYKTTAEYLVSKAEQYQDNIEGTITKVLDKVLDTDESYLTYEIIKLDDNRNMVVFVIGEYC